VGSSNSERYLGFIGRELGIRTVGASGSREKSRELKSGERETSLYL
jgi:hypothetical protein